MNNLTDAKIVRAAPGDNRYGLYDGFGLWLFVQPSGRKGWHVIYEDGEKKSRQVKIGEYPFMGLKQARLEAIEVKKRLLLGMEPNEEKKEATLYDAVLMWYEDWRGGKDTQTERDVWARFKNHVFPDLGNMLLRELKTDHFEDLAISLQADGKHSTARYILIYCKKVFRFKPVRKLCISNPVESIKSSELLRAYEKKNRIRIPIGQLSELVKSIDSYPCIKTRYALQLMLILWTRTMELLGAKWSEFDFSEKLWRIPPERMKMGREFLVPLSRQALVLLEKIKLEIHSDVGVFFKEGQIDEGLLLNAIYAMGYKGKMTTHGFRGLAASYLNELERGEQAIEAQLSHSNASAYNSAEYMRKRKEIMQEWADYVDTLRNV